MAFDWTSLLNSAQKSKNNQLYAALLGAQGAGNTNAAMGFLKDTTMNPQFMDTPGQAGTHPNFLANPNYINPKGYSAASLGSPASGGGGTSTGGGGTPTDLGFGSFDLTTPAGNKAALNSWLASDWSPLNSANTYDPTHDVQQAGGALQDALRAALARKQITQTGYDAGSASFGDDLSKATTFAHSFLSGQGGQLDTQLTDIAKAAKASLASDPTNFHFNDYLQQAKNASQTANDALGSSLQSALASNGFFSVPSALTAAGRAQGAYNPPSSDDLLKALVSQTKGGGGGRGVGNQGVF